MSGITIMLVYLQHLALEVDAISVGGFVVINAYMLTIVSTS